MKIIHKTLGEYIKHERGKLGISLRELARRMGISAPGLFNIEAGKYFPSLNTYKLLSEYLCVPLVSLTQFDNKAALQEFKELVERYPELAFAFRWKIQEVKAGIISVDELTETLRAETIEIFRRKET